jgi:hypothetical protein
LLGELGQRIVHFVINEDTAKMVMMKVMVMRGRWVGDYVQREERTSERREERE